MSFIKKKNKKFLKLYIIILVILLIVLFVFLGKYIYNSFKKYYVLESRFEELEKAKEKDNDKFHTIGWLKIQGTNIDFPILKGVSENVDSPVELESFGWVYGFDEEYHNVMNIYGHNVFNLGPSPKLKSDNFKRFEELMNFIYYDFAKDNKYIQLTINGKEYIYKIFSVSILYAGDVVLFPKDEYTVSEKDKYLKQLQKNNLYKYNLDINKNDNIITVTTCTKFFGTDSYRNILVSGRLLRDGEKLNDYSVKKDSNYKKVEEILKGDDGNEEIGSA